MQIARYQSANGREPFTEWLHDLRDKTAQAKIRMRLLRLETGNFGDVAPVGEGVSELRIHFGPGYRVYFGQHGPLLVVLLCGGSKASQAADIKRAKALWQEWKERQL